MITQQELTDYRAAKSLADQFQKAYEESRERLLARRDEPVEEGILAMKVSEFTSRNFGYVNLVDALGRAETDRLKELMPATTRTVLKVELA